jgi:hypothetical protein
LSFCSRTPTTCAFGNPARVDVHLFIYASFWVLTEWLILHAGISRVILSHKAVCYFCEYSFWYLLHKADLGKKLFSCPRLIQRHTVDFVLQFEFNSTAIFFLITYCEVLFPGILT